ncbi:MAG: response regulator transcription factor [Bacteroidetes bacterium]|nr:response regulator transcription factor [Bacteroidota bacterium]
MNTILLVEDDEIIGPLLRDYLGMNDFEVSLAVNGKAGLAAYKSGIFDLCILDVMMPEMNGFDLAIDISKINPDQRFIFLTSKNLREDVLKGYSLGAFDYILKPFDSEILVIKIKNLLKKTAKAERNNKIGKYLFLFSERKLIYDHKTIKLSQREADLLNLFYENAGSVINRDVALNCIWKSDNYYNINTMDVYISRLRKYLAEDKNILIENIHGKGFKLSVNNK